MTRRSRTKDRVVLINFIFTSCQDACPMATHKLINVRNLMAEVIRDEVWFVSISVDPERGMPTMKIGPSSGLPAPARASRNSRLNTSIS